MTTKATTMTRRRMSPTRKITLRQKTRLKGRVTPQRMSEARVKMKVHNPGPWGDAEIIRIKMRKLTPILPHKVLAK